MKHITIILLFLLSFPVLAQLRVAPAEITGFDAYPVQSRRIHDALTMIETVINSEEFKEKVLAYKFTSTTLTSKKVYEKLMEGREVLGGDSTPYEMNFGIKRWNFGWYYKKKVVAESSPSKTNVIKVSDYFYSYYSIAEIAGNLTHEWTHLMGFTHKNASDRNSVPYAVGYIMRELAATINPYGSQGNIF